MKRFTMITWTLLILLIILNIYDGLTTFILLEHGGKELNPIVNWFIKKFGVVDGLFFIKSITLTWLMIINIWISQKSLNLRQKSVVINSYLIAILYYSYVMYNYNYAYMKSFGM